MFTLKVRQDFYTPTSDDPARIELSLSESIVSFHPADLVTVFGIGTAKDEQGLPDEEQPWTKALRLWNPEDYDDRLERLTGPDGKQRRASGKIVELRLGDGFKWLLVSSAWILGPNGTTIERIAP